MKRILRLDEDDIVRILAKCYKVQPNQIRAYYTETEDEDGDIETKFFIEVEENGQ